MKIDDLFDEPISSGALIERICNVITDDASTDVNEGRVLDIVLRSCTSAEPREIIREILEQNFVALLTRTFGEHEKMAVMFATSFLFGAILSRNILEIEPIRSISDDELRSVSASLLQSILNDNNKLD
ncbi:MULTISPECIES: TetR/AcrR family transcriptional regulator [Rhodobacterales]|nr:MAG: hypothetical protein EP341_00995 [Sphingomonadales bacterium]